MPAQKDALDSVNLPCAQKADPGPALAEVQAVSAPAPKVSSGGGRDRRLDVVRAVAAVLVIGAHFRIQADPGVCKTLAVCWGRLGLFGVPLFFVLSGYLIGGLLLDESDRRGNLNVVRFLIRRGFKIYPLYFVFLAFCLFAPGLKYLPDFSALAATAWNRASDLWPNVLFLQNYVGPNPQAHTWSLAVEEHFYILLPIFLYLTTRARTTNQFLKWLPVALAICLGLRCMTWFGGASDHFLLWATHLHLDALLTGVWLAGMARGKYLQKGLEFASRHALLLLLFGICLCLGYYLPNIEKPFRRTIGCTLATVSASCILMGAANLFQRRSCYGWASPLVGMAALIGRCSYAVYLWHVTVIQLGEKHVYPVFERFGITGDLLWFVTVVCITVLCCLMGIAFTFAVELPFLRFRDRVFPSRGRVTQITGAA